MLSGADVPAFCFYEHGGYVAMSFALCGVQNGASDARVREAALLAERGYPRHLSFFACFPPRYVLMIAAMLFMPSDRDAQR